MYGYRIGQNFRVGKLSQFSRFFSRSQPLNHLLYTAYDGHSLMHRESFPVNSVFCAQPRKFSHSKVLPYTVFFTLSTLRAENSNKRQSGSRK